MGGAVRGGAGGKADENHDQNGRINRQVMDSCVILVGLTPRALSVALTSLDLASATSCLQNPQTLVFC